MIALYTDNNKLILTTDYQQHKMIIQIVFKNMKLLCFDMFVHYLSTISDKLSVCVGGGGNKIALFPDFIYMAKSVRINNFFITIFLKIYIFFVSLFYIAHYIYLCYFLCIIIHSYTIFQNVFHLQISLSYQTANNAFLE